MSWAKLDDGIGDHPKVIEAGDSAFGGWVRLLAYSAKHLSDGRVSSKITRRTLGENNRKLSTLLRVGLLDQVKGGYQIHDYLDYNPSRAEVLTKRAKEAARKRGTRADVPHGVRADGGADSPTESEDPVPSRPVPSPIERDRDREIELAGHEIEARGFSRWGALAGDGVIAIERLKPIRSWEIDLALGSPGGSWKYAARVIESGRVEAARNRSPPATSKEAPPGIARATQRALEKMGTDGPKHPPSFADKIARLLPPKGGG